MTDKEIKELIQAMGIGEEVPDTLAKIIALFRKRKCAICPQEFTLGNLVTCTLLYDMVKPKEKKPNG